MAHRLLAVMVVALVGSLTSTSVVYGQCVLFAAQAADEDERDLLILDPATGLGTPVGDIGAETTGLAFQPSTGILFGSTANIQSGSFNGEELITVNTSTGTGTLVGGFGTAQTMADIAFDPRTGVLYGWRAQGTGDLYTIDPNTGLATLVGESGLSLVGGQGLTFGPNNQLFLAGEGTQGLLRIIDPTTGLSIDSVQLSGYFEADRINSLAYDGRTIYGVTADNSDLITIDPITGVITTIGHAGIPTEDSVDAIAFLCRSSAPTTQPLAMAAIALGLLTIGMRFQRRRN